MVYWGVLFKFFRKKKKEKNKLKIVVAHVWNFALGEPCWYCDKNFNFYLNHFLILQIFHA